MSTYSIKDLEKLSGIKAHTIRIWEQRYGLLTPTRSDTNIRSYDDHQMKKLLNVATLQSAGFKISKISEYSDSEIQEKLDFVYQEQNEKESEYFLQVNNIIQAALNYNKQLMEEELKVSTDRYGFESALEDIFYPSLSKIGQLWRKDELSPAQEHFLSNYIKQKIHSEIENLSFDFKASKKTFLLFLPQWEDHEIALLYGHYLLKKYQHNVIYLGPRVPRINLIETVEAVKPDYLLTFLIGAVTKKNLKQYFQPLSQLSTPTIISGNPSLVGLLNDQVKFKQLSTIHEFKNFLSIV